VVLLTIQQVITIRNTSVNKVKYKITNR